MDNQAAAIKANAGVIIAQSVKHYEATKAACKAQHGTVFPHYGIRDLEAQIRIANQKK